MGATRIFSRLRDLLDVAIGSPSAGNVLTYNGTSWTPATPAVGGSGDMLSMLTSAEVSVTAAATLTPGKMHVCSGTSANYAVTLPGATGNAGKFVGVRMASGLTKLVTLDAGSGVLIDGLQTRVMWAQESAVLLCDGTGWTKVAGKSVPFYGLMRLSSFQNSVGSGVITKVLVDAADVDNSGLMCSVAAHRLVAQRTGIYQTQTVVTLSGGPAYGGQISANTVLQAVLYQNGVLAYAGKSTLGTDGYPTDEAHGTLSLIAGDQLDLYVQHLRGSDASVIGDFALFSYLSALEVPTW